MKFHAFGNALLILAGLAAVTSPALADGAKPVRHWAVEPMSDVVRLPDTEPKDGIADGVVHIVLAKNEFEPGSFVVQAAEKDLGKVSFTLGEFKSKEGKILPAAALDLKFIKVWYQNRNAWYCYFADIGDKLCPELLVNDEDIIRVDTKKKANFARLVESDGSQHELWINAPYQIDTRNGGDYTWMDMHTFEPMKENFKDAKTLLPVAMPKGEYKQFFLTVHATKEIPAGTYIGTVKMADAAGAALGSIPVSVTVLPFELPRPKTYVRPDEDFYVAAYNYIDWGLIKQYNGGNQELMYKQYEVILRNSVEHNQDIHWVRANVASAEGRREALWTVDLMRKVGMRTDVLLGGAAPTIRMWNRPKDAPPLTYRDFYTNGVEVVKFCDEYFGHHNVYCGFGDEPGAGWLVQNRPLFEGYQDAGLKFILAGWNQIFAKNPFAMDWQNVGGSPENAELANKWNHLGLKSAWYATMHVGPENPAFNRRQYGLLPYLAGYTAFCNYAHHLGPYNDNTRNYRPMVNAYGTGDGVIDTLQWEGFREGIDDIRYATLMKRLADKACASDDGATRRIGRKALAFFANFDKEAGDLAAARSRMVDFIMQLRAKVGDAEPDKPRATAKVVPIPPPPEAAPASTPSLSAQLSSAYVGGNFKKGYDAFYTAYTNNFKANYNVTDSRNAMYVSFLSGHPEMVQTICDHCVANGKYNTNDLYQIRFTADVLTAKLTPDRIKGICTEADKRYRKNVDDNVRLSTIHRVGSIVFRGLGDDCARAYWAWRNSVMIPQPKKRYSVAWSDKAITGPESWKDLKLQESVFDRKWQGSAGLLAADVSTGNRGVGSAAIDNSTTGLVSFCAVADVWGLHFRFTDRTAEARKIGMGARGDGSYEIYLAPGIDAPYTCFLYDVNDNSRCGVWGTTYSTAGHRRFKEGDRSMIRNDTVCLDDRVESYLSLSWKNYFTRIPDGTDPWEFEVLRWGDHTSAWNGTAYVHGRETWGLLDIKLAPSQRAKVLRQLLVSAKNSGGDVREYWKDDELGDPAFFEAVVKPEYNGMTNDIARISVDMDEKSALELGKTLLPKLRDFKYTIDAKRVRYAAEKLAE